MKPDIGTEQNIALLITRQLVSVYILRVPVHKSRPWTRLFPLKCIIDTFIYTNKGVPETGYDVQIGYDIWVTQLSAWECRRLWSPLLGTLIDDYPCSRWYSLRSVAISLLPGVLVCDWIQLVHLF